MHFLLTGATGFIGSTVAESILNQGHKLTVLVRNTSNTLSCKVEQKLYNLENLEGLCLKMSSNVDCLIHIAARAYVTDENSLNPLNEYLRINRDATLNLAKIATKHGIKRFVYLSSIKVNGEQTLSDTVFKPDDIFSSSDPYGISKYEAEQALLKLALETEMELVIIRPPLVYGPKVKGNFAALTSLVKRGIPLPFGMINNKRSFIALDNLVHFILLCSDRTRSPKAANRVFLISDGEDVSTSTLLRKIYKAYCIKSRLLPMPISLMLFLAKVLGKSHLFDRLSGNLQVDTSLAYDLLGWKPIITMDEQLKKMAEFEKEGKNT